MLTTASNRAAGEKVRRAVLQLLVRAPLVGLVLLGDAVIVQQNDSITKTMATDGRRIWWNSSWVLRKPLKDVTFDLLHEWLHIFENHPKRRGSRDKKLWNTSADCRVAHCGLGIWPTYKLPDDHVPAFRWAYSLTTEQIYDYLSLPDNESERKEALDNFEAYSGQDEGEDAESAPGDLLDPADLSEQEEADFQQKFATNLLQAVVSIRTARGESDLVKLFGHSVAKRIEEITKISIPWDRLLLGRLVGDLGRQVATWSPPNRRYYPEYLLPSARSRKEKILVILVDISGSINDELLKVFRGAIKRAAARAREVVIITFDERVRDVYRTRNPDKVLQNLSFNSGMHSHTSAVEAFQLAKENKASAIACLTDAYIVYPDEPFPETHFVTPRGCPKPPWGRHYEMDISW